jgi:hypothetical protein
MAFISDVSMDCEKAPSMRPNASRWPPLSTMEMHCGTPISFAFAIAALRSFIAPSDVSFSEGKVSAMIHPCARPTC